MSAEVHATAFPHLSRDEMTCLAELGELRRFDDGERLFESGQRDYSFFAVKSGEVAILETTSGEPRQVVKHPANEFAGDVDILTGRPAFVTAVASGPCEVIEVTAPQIRRVLGEIPSLSDKLLKAFQARRELLEASEFLGVRVLGTSDSGDTTRLREFFYKNRVPHTFFDAETETGRRLLAEFGVTVDDLPAVTSGERWIRRPTLGEVAEWLGIAREIPDDVLDVLIVGAGPAGLAAAVYGASEGLATLVVDRMGPGGQASQSSKIENYMGFPSGLSGAELANRGYLQALKFGAQFTAPVTVVGMSRGPRGEHHVQLSTGQVLRTRTVLIATGVSYRRLDLENCGQFEGAGVFYAATSVEARSCHDSTAVVVGGGNSAGQAAMFLAQHARTVKILLRGDDLRNSMSSYLAARIEKTPNIEVLLHSEVDGLEGHRRLELAHVRDNRSGERTSFDCSGLFIFVGAKPHTDWLPDDVAVDDKGFVLTGPAVHDHEAWALERVPWELETTVPGVFAVGDVRSGTTKRCAFAVGDGAFGITCVHQYLSRSDS